MLLLLSLFVAQCLAQASDPQCVAKAGTCTSTCTGGGTFVSNLCPSFGAAIKCCVKATTPAPLTSTIRTYISPFKGPSATSTKCTTPLQPTTHEKVFQSAQSLWRHIFVCFMWFCKIVQKKIQK